jgi:SNF2 family DNA or RNA helicase
MTSVTDSELARVTIDVNQYGEGELSISDERTHEPIWGQIKSLVLSRNFEHKSTSSRIRLAWPDTLTLVREFGTKTAQTKYNFRFHPTDTAKARLSEFAEQVKAVRRSRQEAPKQVLSADEIAAKLREAGFTKRELKHFQIRDLSHLISLSNGANFSVPGAGKTTVTFALNLLIKQPGQHLIIVAPKAAFQAWKDIVNDCIDPEVNKESAEPFTVLDKGEDQTSAALASGATRFIISYDLAIRQQSALANHIASTPTHLVLDESHRMKAGFASQRGSFLLGIASLPIRRDILSGTPMPQAASDIESQLEFLWPGQGLGREISLGRPPKAVLGNLYVRTTKKELGLPSVDRHFPNVGMGDGQLALYSIVRDEFLRNYAKSASVGLSESQLLKARRSVMRLLQLSVNPTLALNAMANDDVEISSAIVEAVLDEGHSPKMRAVMQHARDIANAGEKVVIWTIFTGTIHSLNSALADLNPVYIHGGVPSGLDSDGLTREGKIKRFHDDPNCSVLIANPAAAGEGISLHTVCHNAIYLDRSYVSTHYLQSIDRIHRLGLPEGQETNIFVYRSRAPAEIGSVDMSVSRRLTEKIRNMQELLDDPDLHEIVYDEQQADDPIDYDVGIQDIVDLIAELENRAPEITEELL